MPSAAHGPVEDAARHGIPAGDGSTRGGSYKSATDLLSFKAA